MDNFIKFLLELGKLKKTARTGWKIREVENAESVADHTFRLTILAWLLPQIKKYDLDYDKVLKMSLIHELAGIYAGDITPYDDLLTNSKEKNQEILAKWPRRAKEDKEKLSKDRYHKEREGVEKLLSLLPKNESEVLFEMWEEFEKGVSREARFVRQIDMLETLLQALEYEEKGTLLSVKAFWEQNKELIDDPVLLEFMEEMDQYFYVKHKADK